MEQVLIATDLYVHNQTNHIVFVNIVWLVECGRAESGNSGRARSATAKKKVSRLAIVCNIGKPYGWHTH